VTHDELHAGCLWRNPQWAVPKSTTFHLILIADALRRRRLSDHLAAFPHPVTTLAALYGLVRTPPPAACWGETDIVIKPFDETNTRVRPDRIMADIKRTGGKALIAWSACSPTSFHAVDLARHFLKAACRGDGRLPCRRLPVDAAGGTARDQDAMDMASRFAGEAEAGRLDAILQDAWNGTLKPLYNYMDDLPGIENAPTPLPSAARPQ
jgi:hypothetical protein